MKLSKLSLSCLVLSFILVFSFYLLPQTTNAQELQPGKVYQWDNLSVAPVEVPGVNDITAVVTGESFNLALRIDGTVWAWGNNQYGQLGDGTTNSSITPIQVKGPGGQEYLKDIKAIAAGRNYSLALRKDGTVWVWGDNGYGTRGTGIGIANTLAAPLLFPTQVKANSGDNLTSIVEIAAGGNHSLALKSDGTLLSWGENASGQLGIGCFLYNCSSAFFPKQVIAGVVSIAAGRLHSLAVKSDGTVWGWGRPNEGELASFNNNTSQQPSPIQIIGLANIKEVVAKEYYSIALSKNGSVYEWGGGRWANPRQIPDIHDVKTISAGRSLSLGGVAIGLALKNDGTVWQWNKNDITPQQVLGLSSVNSISGSEDSTLTPNFASISVNSPPQPFLSLPWDYQSAGKSFDDVALNPNSWFDHQYPLQNIPCCTFTILPYSGIETNDAYRSHSGYDYASQDGVTLGTPVLAAASGLATFTPDSKSEGAGNVIKINHGNGYQTWYEHLSPDGLITSIENSDVPVIKGDVIGYVGMTGNTNGPHIHLSVMKDSNENGTFTDDYPFGLVDPLGWEGATTDPWEEWTLNGRNGSKSYNLFADFHQPPPVGLSNGGSVINDYVTIIIPPDAYSNSLTVTLKTGPFMAKNINTKSVAPSLLIEAFNALQQKITQFLAPVEIDYDYSKSDLSNVNEDSLVVYYYDETNKEWEALPTTVDKNSKKAVAFTTHFTRFALMGTVKDLIPPVTQVYITGAKGQDHWYRSDINISLDGSDNDGGIGIESTIYTINGKDWGTYTNPITFTEEGNHFVTFMSYDKADNREKIKTLEFNIDKTPPLVSLSTDSQTLWPPDERLVPVVITGSMTDQNMFDKNIHLIDEYGLNNLDNLNYDQTILLPATRNGEDHDGRDYTVEATAQDLAGNKSVKQVHILVPHDQRN
jgi:alpha-tubulin suppressor-like RCC1 family protein/murein DD-endopeptidase MepM/ murein hydrolase activator NlpD